MLAPVRKALRASLFTFALFVSPMAFAGPGLPVLAQQDHHDGHGGDQAQHKSPCEVDVHPYSHSVDDGHEHFHHKEAVGAHEHGGEWHHAHHTHGDAGHGGHMEGGRGEVHHSDGCDQTGMARMMFEDQGPLISMSLTDAVIGDTPSVIVHGEAYAFDTAAPVEELIWTSDEDLASAGLPGSGTMMDPYIIENRFVTQRLELRNTDACVVVRNNVATGTYLKGPMVAPEEIRDLVAVHDQMKAVLDEKRREMEAAKSARDAARSAYRDTLPAYRDYLAARKQANAGVRSARAEFGATRKKISAQRSIIKKARRSAAAAHAAIKADNDKLPPLTNDLLAFVENNSRQSDGQFQEQFEQIRQAGADIAAAKARIPVLRTQLAEDRKALSAARQVASGVKVEHADAIRSRQDALALLRTANVDTTEARREVSQANKDVNEVGEMLQIGSLEYAGRVFKTKDDIVAWVLSRLKPPKEEDALIVLDWNGTCVHAYHNVTDDLRVNQNTARTGYATGGLIENNRFHDVSQLRHYDGIFRENEVGNRDILNNFLNGETWTGDRAINVDGFNQGMLLGNTFYGRVDLDFHGHHHGTGFFSPHSHYHGNDKERLMGHDGHMKHDHRLRWTSVRFAENVVIDPAGAGLRYEDRNHAGDDRRANSENVKQLNEPHIHRSLIELHHNVVVGSVFVDVFNADGIDIWSDDYSRVRYDARGRILDAVKHLGADIISTHRARNNGWLSIAGNRIIDPSGGLSAITIQAVKEAEIDISDNTAASIGVGAKPSTADFENLDLSTIDWGGSDNHNDSAIMMRGVKESLTSICGNAAFGFDSGVTATHAIQDGATIDVCEDNDIGSVNIVYTPVRDHFSVGDFIQSQVADMFGDSAALVVGGAVEPVADVEYRLPR